MRTVGHETSCHDKVVMMRRLYLLKHLSQKKVSVLVRR